MEQIIKLFKLKTGEEFISQLNSEDDNYYYIHKPALFITDQRGNLGIRSWIWATSQDDMNLPKDALMLLPLDIPQDVMLEYSEWESGNKKPIPEKPRIQTLS